MSDYFGWNPKLFVWSVLYLFSNVHVYFVCRYFFTLFFGTFDKNSHSWFVDSTIFFTLFWLLRGWWCEWYHIHQIDKAKSFRLEVGQVGGWTPPLDCSLCDWIFWYVFWAMTVPEEMGFEPMMNASICPLKKAKAGQETRPTYCVSLDHHSLLPQSSSFS